MKNQNLIDDLLTAVKAAVQYWNDLAIIQRAMEHVYVRKWQEEDPATDYMIHILVNPHGSLARVTHRYFVNGDLLREEHYLATYGGQSNGNLVGLGIYRNLIFDPAQRLVYFEDWPKGGELTVEIFEQL